MMVSRVKVEDPICGHTALIKGWRDDEGIFRAELKTECPHLQSFAEDLNYMETEMEDLYHVMSDVYECAVDNNVPATCPVPTAIINAWWLEADMIAKSLAHKSTITIEVSQKDGDGKKDVSKVRVNTPLCDYVILVRAKKTPEGKIKISFATNCPHLRGVREKLPEIGPEEIAEHDATRVYEIADELKFTPICFAPLAMTLACMMEAGKLDKEALADSIRISYPKE
ncbi:DUF6951 family protein [Methermicoccus shengliensis]|uniref:Uncharacterized protein n=1 Tax=Methermicoccus shengliensis TaxID=660064 RepID=A0A832VND5_9EURY|nr:hypothetical protein [Methermicoccus shengliensis]